MAGFDIVFVELYEAVPFVEAAGRASAQHFQPHRQALRASASASSTFRIAAPRI
jgi:hypothetical protein